MAIEGRKICCCGALMWSKVIAWLQIISNAIEVVYTIAILAIGANLTVEEKHEHSITATVLAILIFSLVMAIVGVLFGIILLVGANQSRPSYLMAWIVFTSVLLIWSIVEASFGGGSIAVRIVACVINILISGFGIWVVWVLKEEIVLGTRTGQSFN